MVRMFALQHHLGFSLASWRLNQVKAGISLRKIKKRYSILGIEMLPSATVRWTRDGAAMTKTAWLTRFMCSWGRLSGAEASSQINLGACARVGSFEEWAHKGIVCALGNGEGFRLRCFARTEEATYHHGVFPGVFLLHILASLGPRL